MSYAGSESALLVVATGNAKVFCLTKGASTNGISVGLAAKSSPLAWGV